MNSFVTNEFVLAAKSFVARYADECFDARMNNAVTLEFTLSQKGLVAHRANVIAYAKMDIFVIDEGGFGGESIGALITEIFSFI